MTTVLRWSRHIALGLAALLFVTILVLVWLWQDRQSIDDIGWPNAASIFEPTDLVTVTWLGISTLLFDDQETQILIDGNFTRLSPFEIALFRPVISDVATINYALAEFEINRLAAIVPVHSHFDHAMDIGHIANRTNAVILGSESTTNIARGALVPVDQYQVLAEGETRQFGDFTIRLLESKHAPVKPGGKAPWFAGTIDEPLWQPASVNAWKQGVVWSIFIGHPRGTTLIQGSGGFVEGKLHGETADVVMLGIARLKGLGKEYVTTFWNETVPATGATRVIPVHYDDYTAPFGEVRLFPNFVDNIVVTTGWIDQILQETGSDVTIELPPFGQPIPLY